MLEILKVIKKKYAEAKNRSVRAKGGKFYVLQTKIQTFLTKLSGNDLIAMICDVLSKEEKAAICRKYTTALRGISRIFNDKKKQKNTKKDHLLKL